jgi:hypothetical protein
MASIGQDLVRVALGHDHEHATVLCATDGGEHTAEDVAGQHGAESRIKSRPKRFGSTFRRSFPFDGANFRENVLEPGCLEHVHPTADQHAVRELGDRDAARAHQHASRPRDRDDQDGRDRLLRFSAASHRLQPMCARMNDPPDTWPEVPFVDYANQGSREHGRGRQSAQLVLIKRQPLDLFIEVQELVIEPMGKAGVDLFHRLADFATAWGSSPASGLVRNCDGVLTLMMIEVQIKLHTLVLWRRHRRQIGVRKLFVVRRR